MQEAAKNLLLVLVALFPIVDPLGGSPFFLALTREYAAEARRALSWRIAMNSFFLLVGSYFVGTYVLDFLGISLPVVQIGGGLIVMATGWTLLTQRDDEKHDMHTRNWHLFGSTYRPLAWSFPIDTLYVDRYYSYREPIGGID
jgi:multiple antibiotic resistance protein